MWGDKHQHADRAVARFCEAPLHVHMHMYVDKLTRARQSAMKRTLLRNPSTHLGIRHGRLEDMFHREIEMPTHNLEGIRTCPLTQLDPQQS